MGNWDQLGKQSGEEGKKYAEAAPEFMAAFGAMGEAAAKAAEAGAENSKNFVSRFGRAKSYGQQTIGTPDAGAVSMKYFFVGLAKK